MQRTAQESMTDLCGGVRITGVVRCQYEPIHGKCMLKKSLHLDTTALLSLQVRERLHDRCQLHLRAALLLAREAGDSRGRSSAPQLLNHARLSRAMHDVNAQFIQLSPLIPRPQ